METYICRHLICVLIWQEHSAHLAAFLWFVSCKNCWPNTRRMRPKCLSCSDLLWANGHCLLTVFSTARPFDCCLNRIDRCQLIAQWTHCTMITMPLTTFWLSCRSGSKGARLTNVCIHAHIETLGMRTFLCPVTWTLAVNVYVTSPLPILLLDWNHSVAVRAFVVANSPEYRRHIHPFA